MALKQLLNLNGVKNFEKYNYFNEKLINGLSEFSIGYASNLHLYIPQSKVGIPELRICYIEAKEEYLIVSEVANNLPLDERYSKYYEFLNTELAKNNCFKKKNESSYIIDKNNIDAFIKIVNYVFKEFIDNILSEEVAYKTYEIQKNKSDFINQEKIDKYLNEHSQLKSFKEIKTIIKEMIKKNVEFDIFLSHRKHDERDVVYIWNILNSEGFSVYIDWVVDEALDRNSVNKETAKIIRERMRQSKCLLYFCTINSNLSKWMPWELGYFDGMNKKIAILPFIETKKKGIFVGREYLGIYPICMSNLTLQSGEKLKEWIK